MQLHASNRSPARIRAREKAGVGEASGVPTDYDSLSTMKIYRILSRPAVSLLLPR